MLAETGIYGKLPSYGDFIARNLPTTALETWDGWLQNFISSGQQQLGEQWLDIYLTSPIWRFALSAGVLDEQSWFGFMMPSVDKVGRYFPVSVMQALPANACVSSLLQSSALWFDAAEQLLLNALQQGCELDQLLQDLNDLPLNWASGLQARSAPAQAFESFVSLDESLKHTGAGLGQLLDSHYRMHWQSFSLWQSGGSSLVEPCMFACPSLPKAAQLVAMLDGNWQASGWRNDGDNSDGEVLL
ncbi:type VI secretion system-associated protein TagF [Agaribacterium haliotis]|uniref:type VI secretion system-associated protein TagF n=1 Tax=Agaribacterium haliotis TaxID=2013869 RepID=UPI000BB57D19|nr:type VI secretion system-associated protein TagF [Agaribacterium haliotis]